MQKSSHYFQGISNKFYFVRGYVISLWFLFHFYKIRLNSIKFVIIGSDRRMQVCNRSRAYNYFFMIEIIRTAHSIIPVTHLRKTGISAPPYMYLYSKGKFYTQCSWKYTCKTSKNTKNNFFDHFFIFFCFCP